MIRWGVLSTAKIGREHVIPAILSADGASLTAIASRNKNKAKELSLHFNAPFYFGSYEDLLSSSEIDAIYIPLPTSDHILWSLKAAEMGKHVLCEKPISLNANDIDTLIKVANKHDVLISEAFMVTYHPQWIKVKELISENIIGEINQVNGVFTYFNKDPKNMRNRIELGGGALPDIGVYPVVTTRYATSSEPVSVTARITYDDIFNTDKYASAQVEFANFQLSFYCSTQMSLNQHMTFHGDKGRIEIYAPFNARTFDYARFTVHSRENTEVSEYKFGDIDQYRIQIEEFSKAIKTGNKKKIFSLEDSKNNQKVIDKIYKSHHSNTSQIID